MLAAWALVWGYAAARRDAMCALAAGVAIGAAIATRQTLAVFLVPLLAMLLWNGARSPKILAGFALGCTPALLWQAWYNTIRTGSFYLPAATLPQFQNLSADGNIIEGLAGMLISPGKSIFLYSPLLLLSLPGIRAFVRRSQPLALGLVAALIVYGLVHASIRNWAGEWGWGPRYLVPLTFPLALPAVLVLGRARESGAPALRLFAMAVLAAGLAIQGLALSTNWHYCYSWLVQQGRFDLRRLAWSVEGNQLVETARMLGENLARFAGRDVAIRMVNGAAPATQAASNSINVWPVTAVREGVPQSVVAIACLGLAVVCVITMRAAFVKARAVEVRAA
jgi:4-amino-4-deoxy-L-arabinose transferase-like glycosyltransferase